MESKREQQLRGTFEFLKGLGCKGLCEFEDYDKWKAAKMKDPTKTMNTAKPRQAVLPLEAEPVAERLTNAPGQTGFAVQHALAERKEWFAALTPAERLEYEQMFGEDRNAQD
jgi:hypothetical protein